MSCRAPSGVLKGGPWPAKSYAVLAIGVAAAGLARCRERAPEPRIELLAVQRCEAGVQRAELVADDREASRIYHRACAGVHAEPSCREAFVRAAEAEQGDTMKIVIAGCREAYCPVLGADRFELCQRPFEPSNPAVFGNWPAFHEAIIEHDARGLAPRVTRALLRYYGARSARHATGDGGPR